MNITYKQASEILLNKYKDSIINTGMEVPDGYLFNIQPKDWDDNDVNLAGFFKVLKTNGKIMEYSPVMDPEEFKKALANPIFVRDRK